MNDYRDDRQVLRQRAEELARELEQARARAASAERDAARAEELERQVDELQAQLSALRHGRRRTFPVPFVLTGVAVVFAVGWTLVFRSREASGPAPQVTARATADPKPASTPKRAPSTKPIELTVSETCRCVSGSGVTAALAYRAGAVMSLGGHATHMPSLALRVLGLASDRAAPLDIPLRVGPHSVPPAKVEGGDVRMLMACLSDRMVLAYEQRVSAWSIEDGQPLWSATLPAPVGTAQSGPLRFECDALPAETKGRVVIAHAGGKTTLNAEDGSPLAR